MVFSKGKAVKRFLRKTPVEKSRLKPLGYMEIKQSRHGCAGALLHALGKVIGD
jgi:hypothetical protein